MAIGISEEHEELRQAVKRFIDANIPPAAARAVVAGARPTRPEFWSALCEPGWIGLHVAERYGGAGYGLVEQAVVLEELGRACAPGPYLATVVAAAILDEAGGPAAETWLAKLTTGACTATVALSGATARRSAATSPTSSSASVDDDWYALDSAPSTRSELPSVDPTRRVAEVDLDGVVVAADRRLDGLDAARVRDLSRGAPRGRSGRRRPMVRDHRRRVRQGPRPVRAADRPVPRREAQVRRHARPGRARPRRGVGRGPRGRRRAATVSLTASRPRLSLALDAAFTNAKDCIQVLGGIGFTWEHDAHLYLRRALTLGSTRRPARRVAGAGGTRRPATARAARLALDLGAAADATRAEVRALPRRGQGPPTATSSATASPTPAT